jgi:S1-C subfamily serine protease
MAFGAALIVGGIAGAVVMGTVGNRSGGTTDTSTGVAPSQPQQNPFGRFFGGNGGGISGQNPLPGGAGSSGSSGSTGSSSTGSSSIDANAIAAKVDPGVVDIISVMSDGTAEGTGMVITSGGQVLTNNHVIQGAVRVTARTVTGNRTYGVTVVGTDPTDDVALLQLQGASNLSTVKIGDPSTLKVGDPILAIGNALGRNGMPAVAAGQVVATGQQITATDDTGANPETLSNLIQVDANVLPGDSGGPLVNSAGEVIGMDTAASQGSGRGFRFRGVSSAQGFAIPISDAMNIVPQLRNGSGAPTTSSAQKALLGVEVADGTSQGVTSGALVVGVAPGTPAESAGLVAGDVITTFAGKTIGSYTTLSTAVKAAKPGDKVSIGWTDQNGQQHSATVQLVGQSAPAA